MRDEIKRLGLRYAAPYLNQLASAIAEYLEPGGLATVYVPVVPGATPGNIAVFDANGHVADGGPPGGGGGGGAGASYNVYHFVDPALSIQGDPSRNEVAAGATASNAAQFTVMYVGSVTIPIGVAVTSAFLFVEWSSRTLVGSGMHDTKWMLSTGVETLGAAPSVSAVEVVGTVTSGPGYATHARSGVVKHAALPVGPYKLVLVGKPSTPGDTVVATVFDESRIEFTN